MAEMDVGSRIRYFRRLRGLTQEQLALQAGLNPAFLGHLEHGLKSPTVRTLDKLVKALHITLEELFAEEVSVKDQTLDVAVKRLVLLVRGLPAGQIDKIVDIIQSVIEFSEH